MWVSVVAVPAPDKFKVRVGDHRMYVLLLSRPELQFLLVTHVKEKYQGDAKVSSCVVLTQPFKKEHILHHPADTRLPICD